MVAENRAARLDLAAGTKFTKQGRLVQESRHLIEAQCAAAESWHVVAERTAGQLSLAAEVGEIEVG